MAERRVKVETEVGLHARPAALFVQAATKAPMEVTVAKSGDDPVDAKSILSVIGLDVRQGDEILITAEGDGADTVLDELVAMVTGSGA
ncbi:MAG: HPr family phosphocarrier protein [Actinoallomurus sp.]|jgi:phosphocarrier protein HPr|nr:HPr family phosphocarrier protein [Actinoallomurus sp.]